MAETYIITLLKIINFVLMPLTLTLRVQYTYITYPECVLCIYVNEIYLFYNLR